MRVGEGERILSTVEARAGWALPGSVVVLPGEAADDERPDLPARIEPIASLCAAGMHRVLVRYLEQGFDPKATFVGGQSVADQITEKVPAMGAVLGAFDARRAASPKFPDAVDEIRL